MMKSDEQIQREVAEIQQSLNEAAMERIRDRQERQEAAKERAREKFEAVERNDRMERDILELKRNMEKVLRRYESCVIEQDESRATRAASIDLHA